MSTSERATMIGTTSLSRVESLTALSYAMLHPRNVEVFFDK